MKRFVTLMLAIILALTPMSAEAATTPAPTVEGTWLAGQALIFHPAIDSVVVGYNRMSVTVDTTTTCWRYVIQVSDRADFKNAKTYYRLCADWANGPVEVWMDNLRSQKRRTRRVYYDGRLISYRSVPYPQMLTFPVRQRRQIEKRFAIRKTFSVPKGKYVRVRCIYAAETTYYSKWSTRRVK